MSKVFLATATAVCVLLLVGCSQTDAGTTTGGATPPTVEDSSATPTPTASESAGVRFCPNPYGGACLGPLEPGQYQTSVFEPQIIYTVPAGWTNFEDLRGNFWLFQQDDPQDGGRGGSFLGIYQNINAAAIDCREARQEGVGFTSADLIAWYQSVPGLIVSEPQTVTVGGLEGLQFDLALEPGVETCTFDGHPGIPVLIGNGVSDLHHVILEELDIRLVILDWREGNVTLEITNVREQHSAEEYRALLQPIIDSIQFDG